MSESTLRPELDRQSFQLSCRLVVTITIGANGLVAEFDPEMPAKLTDKELRRYRAARHEMAERLAEKLGGRVAIVGI